MVAERFDFDSEVRLIPGVAKVIAVALFACMTVVIQGALLREPNPPALPFRIFFGLFIGALVAVVVLLVGYVNRDSKRRGMNSTLWTLLAIFVPNALGFVLYFLLRHPLVGSCPQCRAPIQAGFNFCPRCRFMLAPSCGTCGHALQQGFLCCPQCGQEVKTPA